jgi:hypothetical protein
MNRFGWWPLAAFCAVFVTGPLLVLAPLGLAVLTFGVAALLIGMATKTGKARRAPMMALGALWLVLGAVMLVSSPVHTSFYPKTRQIVRSGGSGATVRVGARFLPRLSVPPTKRSLKPVETEGGG